MDADLALSIGMVLAVVSLPSLLSAFSEARAPRLAALMIIVASGSMIWAATTKPGGYSLGDLPYVLISVIARYIS
ncbi:MAG: hypothetical protein ACQEUH_08180 [Pseudomonadota bacterium]